jgi:hypothetical protein
LHHSSGTDRFTPGQRAQVAQWVEGWLGARVGLEAVEKRKISCPCEESNPTVQSVATPTELPQLNLEMKGSLEYCRVYV